MRNKGSLIGIITGLLVIMLAVGLVITHHRSTANPASSTDSCTSKSFASGASGACVTDIQNLVNPQAYGIDGELYIPVTGSFDAKTVSAVKTFQKNFNLSQTGSISAADWSKLCDASDPTPAFTKAAQAADCKT